MATAWRAASGLLLPLVPALAVFGNALVIIAVYREKCLQTVTNLLIVSLAISDFMVAICVMSFGVYYERNDFRWNMGQFFCNVYLASDVTCSTASILNLLAISLDRYIAISHPISYAQYGARGGRAMISISIVWAVSVIVGLPILLGVNPMEEDLCELGNAYFNILSSLLSFFFPCAAMIVLYSVIFRRLRQRERARSLRRATRLENCKMSSALLGGARMARQMGNHFKNRTDQILLEISFQTSSYPSLSDSSEDISTLTPLANEVNFGSTMPASHLNSLCTPITKEGRSCVPSLTTNGDLHKKPACRAQNAENCEFTTKPVHRGSSGISRSFGDDLLDAIPFIDGESSSTTIENSKEQGGDVKQEERKPALQTASVAVHERKRSSCHMPPTCDDLATLNSAFKSASAFTFVVDISPLSTKNTSLIRNGEALRDNRQCYNELGMPKPYIDVQHRELPMPPSLSESAREYKSQIWKSANLVVRYLPIEKSMWVFRRREGNSKCAIVPTV
ncbi:hypothetical protein Y032_0046g1313 [Ancylostoma ceylanicum]|uniref:G-protein coupled receptors family 1 profile domain-containing protein n=1 Tax=Ancylostoma ceylanicum TaxID=53326 RepID=A0A016UCE8_9BILA|nr:hypothetical protein Y032_0046g1313 [Ancylostoma ceylanicum]